MINPRTVYDSSIIGDGKIYETNISIGNLEVFIRQNKEDILLLKPYTKSDNGEDLSLIEGVDENDDVTSTSLYKIEACEPLSHLITKLTKISEAIKKL